MTLRDLLLILLVRWRLVAATTLIALVVVAGVNISLPKQYRASATVVVDIKGADPVAGSSSQGQVIPGYLATQVGIVGSNRVVERVVDTLQLDRDPQLRALWQSESSGFGAAINAFIRKIVDGISEMLGSRPPVQDAASKTADPYRLWLVARLTRNLDVRPARDGNLIEIAVIWEDAARAEQIANGFAQAYIDTNLELKVEPAKQYVKWFEERNLALRKNLEKAQARLSDYQRKKGVVASADARLDVENTRLSELSSQLTALQGTRAESASRELQSISKRDSMTEVLQNPVIISLKGELAKLELRRAETTKRYGENYPDMQRLDSQIATAKERIDQEIARVNSSLSASNQINLQREVQIEAQLASQRQRVLELTQKRDEIAVLQNDVANAQKIYDSVTQRLAQTSLESQNQMTNVMIVTPAITPMSPSSPRIKVNLVLALLFGFLFGTGLALLLERLDQRLYGVEHLRDVIGAPVFGTLRQRARLSSGRRPFRLALGT